MDITLAVSPPLGHPCPALIVGCFETAADSAHFAEMDEALAGIPGELYRLGEFSGKQNTVKLLHTFGRIPADRVLLVGLGKRRDADLDRLRHAAGTAMQALRMTGIKEIASTLHLNAAGMEEGIQAVAEGFLLGGYEFSAYKTDLPTLAQVQTATLLLAGPEEQARCEPAVRRVRTIAEAVLFCRDLVSQPGNVATPSYLAERAMEMAGRTGLECHILDREELERNGMEALLAVSRGSKQAPKFITLEYRGGAQDDRPVVIVGKGVTFDSGGISLKPREGMERMKDDMAGGAAVLGTMMAVAGLGLPCNVVGLVPAAENLPDGGAYKPGDIIRSMAGKTIEVVNTDAEGRMLLCDALHYAHRYRPAALIDLATLTGACVVALGPFASGLMGNDEGLKRALKKAGEASGERLWELPLWEEYGELMKSDVADLKNAGGPAAGTISAGWFLSRFAEKMKWAHLDIAGTAWEEKGRGYLPKGATGVGVRLLVEFLRGISRGK
ncbi:MAG TPA: leucyl aminopeptidase [Geobacteraceae bacterium]|nr:leucyl aminopeptidase [Geobacteraceae bacterium]